MTNTARADSADIAPMPDELALSIIVISYNTRDLTLAALDSLFRFPPAVSFEVIVLDNASQDGSAEAIAARFPQVHFIAHPENIGFAAGNNVAAKYARGHQLLLLNPDTLILEQTFPSLIDFVARRPDRRIWGGRTLFTDHSLNPTSCWRRMTLWSLFCSATGLTYAFPSSQVFSPESYGNWRRDQEADVDIVTGCFLLIDHGLWRQLGGFDPTFFMYAEEADLCLRAKALGAKPGIAPGVELVHYGGASEVTGIEKVIKTTRGRVTLMKKHWSGPAYAAGRAMLLLWSFARMVGSSVWAGRQDGEGQSRHKWHDIWRRRSEWLTPYPVRSAGNN